MFGRGRRKSRAIVDMHIDFEQFFEPQIVAVDALDLSPRDVAAVSPGAESDARFFEMIALLDTSLADLLSTCDRIEREVAAAYQAG